jgi:hypothetical protein
MVSGLGSMHGAVIPPLCYLEHASRKAIFVNRSIIKWRDR